MNDVEFENHVEAFRGILRAWHSGVKRTHESQISG